MSSNKEREQLMTLLGQFLKRMVDDKDFLLIIKSHDDSIDFVTNNGKEAVHIAARYIELIEKHGKEREDIKSKTEEDDRQRV